MLETISPATPPYFTLLIYALFLLDAQEANNVNLVALAVFELRFRDTPTFNL